MSNQEFWDNLVAGKDLNRVCRQRSNDYQLLKYSVNDRSMMETQGWDWVKDYGDKKHCQMKKRKLDSEIFENRVWMMLYRMGFQSLNRDQSFNIQYDKGEGNQQQIDVFALDEETALVVECKSTTEEGKRRNFKEEIQSFNSVQPGIRESIKERFGTVKVKFIFATNNYLLNKEDLERLDKANIAYFDEKTIEDYTKLAKQLGPAAKYQLLGKLFAGRRIQNMASTVPAIRGSMGGHTYYSFSIEPERLLQIGYVLHRNDANSEAMPTYQRMIKKSRLTQLRKFIENKGYFANSIIISLDSKRSLQFDLKAAAKETDSQTSLGILHLPQCYRSAYIIDGQHRLYGYSGTKYAKTNTIPVVAFENMNQEEQVKLFMDINENQKAVPKQLRNTLDADLLYDSPNYQERRKALALRIALKLGDDSDSPLYGRIITGEESNDSKRCVTMDMILKAIKESGFLTEFRDNKPRGKVGLFDNADGDNSVAYNALTPFIKGVLNFFAEQLPEEWERGKSNEGLLAMNSGIFALIRISSDVLKIISDRDGSMPLYQKTSVLLERCSPYFKYIVDFYNTMTPQNRQEIKQQYGGNGPIKHWRYLQKAIFDKCPQLTTVEYQEWWEKNSKEYNANSQQYISEISKSITGLMHKQLVELNGRDDESIVPIHVREKYLVKIAKKNEASSTENVSIWDYLNLKDYAEIAISDGHWRDTYSNLLTLPKRENETKKAKKENEVQWMKLLQSISDKLKNPGYSVSKVDYEYIQRIHEWCMQNYGQNNA
ncbi:DGQHR domain-containing protein [Bifidobacterium sp. ESL0732]|uniref:DGQHR domain-containing protein n=1 Tax=Bifidobacterium sp. ESL0732 TaxID=2983222 RepID=UPI0023F76906|nr:DGQHR domain-containing protein [Bifidobacterium sp. ESL0732]WEV63477.1 DGQHR domain-containing protein [Bifidobacterium sp. ESL0732]